MAANTSREFRLRRPSGARIVAYSTPVAASRSAGLATGYPPSALRAECLPMKLVLP